MDMSSAERKRDFSASLLPFHFLTITSHPSSIGFVALTSVFGIFDTYQRTDRPRERKGVSPLSLSCAGISTLAYRRLQSAKRGERQHKSRETFWEGLQRGGGGGGTDHSWDACASARVRKSLGLPPPLEFLVRVFFFEEEGGGNFKHRSVSVQMPQPGFAVPVGVT